MIMTIGGDAHKRTHTFVVADPTGRRVAEHTFAATTECHIDAQRVVRVPTQLMAGVRKSARTPGKSDPIDALSLARAALREPDLPVAQLTGPERHVKLRVDHRDDLMAERLRVQCRLHCP